MGSLNLVIPKSLRHQPISLRYSQPLISPEVRPFLTIYEAHRAGIFGFPAPGRRSRLGVNQPRLGGISSCPGVTGSRLGVTGARPGVIASRPGVTGSRLGAISCRLQGRS